VTLSLSLLAAVYAIGLVRFSASSATRPSMLRVLAMAAGLLVIEATLCAPLDELADHLLSAHMTQHLLLMLLAAPLLVAARPMPALAWSLPLQLRTLLARAWNRAGIFRLVRLMLGPAVRWGVFCATVIVWHIPALYRWAMRGPDRHALMQLSFMGAALLFWSGISARSDRGSNPAGAGLYVFSAALLTGVPGALITFAGRPLYVDAADGSRPFGLTALADQQLAGLIMWIPMDLILFATALALIGTALETPKSSIAKQ
jgi:putative membrane protein